MSAAGRRVGCPAHVHLVPGAKQRQIFLRTDVGDDLRRVRRGQRQSHHRALEGQVGDRRRADACDAPGRRVYRDANTFRAHHQGRVHARFDRGVAWACFQRRAQHLDLDVVPIDPAGLSTRPQIRLPDEAGDENRRGLVNLGGSPDLVDVAGVHDRNAVTHRQRFLLVVGHIDERDPDFALDALEFELHHLAQLQVEGAKRFVEQQCAGVVHQRTGQRHPLLLPTGELGGAPLGEVGQPDDPEQFVDPLADLTLGQLLAARPVGDVVPHRHVREQRIVLEHGVDVALVGRHFRDVGALEPDRTDGRALESCDHPQRRRLAAARGASIEKNSPDAMEKSASATAV